MKATVLVDNKPSEGLGCEWGFAALIETGEANILLDTGASGLFVENARALGVDIASVDYGVLSHAHFDHADGLAAFFSENDRASFFVQPCCAENCFGGAPGKIKYIGIARGTLAQYTQRIVRVEGDVEFIPGCWLVGHATPGLDEIGKAAQMYVEVEGELVPDDFSHEQSLVVETPSGLVVFNSCSHGGVDAIVSEVRRALPGKHIHALVGGLHLFELSDDEVRAVAAKFRDLGIEKVYTGHCTGDRAIEILREELGDAVQEFCSGFTFEA